mgnify:CR=1 FL=1
MQITFRHHRGGLEESLKTIKHFNNMNEFLNYIYSKVRDKFNLEFSYYSEDDSRIGWKNIYIVCERNAGVLGFVTFDKIEERKKQNENY